MTTFIDIIYFYFSGKGDKDHGMSGGIVALIVVLTLLVIVLGALLLFCLVKKKKRSIPGGRNTTSSVYCKYNVKFSCFQQPLAAKR